MSPWLQISNRSSWLIYSALLALHVGSARSDDVLPNQPQPMIADTFTAGSTIGSDHLIPCAPPLLTSMRAIGADAAAQSAGIDSLVGMNPGLQLQTAYRVEVGSHVPLHGKVFRVSQIRRDQATGRASVDFVAVKEESLASAISQAGDTFFIPFDCRGMVRQARFTVAMAPDDDSAKQRAAVFRFKPPFASDRSPLKLTDAQSEQRIKAGDVIRYGNYGLKVRSIVPPSPEKKVLGWVEVQNTEVVFDAK